MTTRWTRDGIEYESSDLSRALDAADDVMVSRRHRLSSYSNEEYAAVLREVLPRPDLRSHMFSHIDPDERCPTCGFPAWTHDPAMAYLNRQRIVSADAER